MFGIAPSLSDAAIVVRGGLMATITMRTALETCLRRQGFYGLSFFGCDLMSVESIVQMSEPLHNHSKIRVSTAGRMREAGFDPEFTGEFPHLTVKFEVSPTDDEIETLSGVFDDPIPTIGQTS